MLSLPKQIPVQLLLYKTTTCLIWPATTESQMKKKPCLKQQLQNLSSEGMQKKKQTKKKKNKTEGTIIKNKHLPDYIYCNANL